jgi:hypothetical protein
MNLIEKPTGRQPWTPFVLVLPYRLDFSTTAAELANMRAGRYVRFFEERERMYFVVGDVDPNGYKLVPVSGGRVSVNSATIARKLQQFRHTGKTLRLAVRATTVEFQGTVLFEIDTKVPLNLKQNKKYYS